MKLKQPQMLLPSTKCIKKVGGEICCPLNDHPLCIKYGRSKDGKQRYYCKICCKTFLNIYVNKACLPETSNRIVCLLKEGCGIRSIARLLKISMTTVLKRIVLIARTIKKPIILIGREYELDEMRTYIKSKKRKRWIVYAIRKDTKEVIDFAIGSRTNKTLQCVTETLILSQARKVYTDKLPSYKSLLPEEIHSTRFRAPII